MNYQVLKIIDYILVVLTFENAAGFSLFYP